MALLLATGRLVRLRPVPRLAPKAPTGAFPLAGAALAGWAAAVSAGAGAGEVKSAGAGDGAPDFSLSDMAVFWL